MANKAPSFTRILRTDYFSSLVFLFPFIGCVVIGVLLVTFQSQGYSGPDPECCYPDGIQPEQIPVILIFASTTFTLLAWSVLLWRCQMIQSVFKEGVKVSGVVSNALLYGDRLRLEYNYMHQGRKYTTSNVVYKNKWSQPLEIGRRVTVTLDPQNPKHAFIYAVYLVEPGAVIEEASQASVTAEQSLKQSQESLQGTCTEIEFHGQYNKKLYYKTVILAALPSKRATAIRLLVFAGFVVLWLNVLAASIAAQNSLTILWLMFMILVIGYILGQPYFLAWRGAAITWKQTNTQALLAGRVTEWGITYHSPFSNENFKWEEFAAVRKFQDVLTLVTDDARLSGHSPDFFNSAEDWERFQQIVARKVIEAK